MKRIIITLLSIFILLNIVACGGNETVDKGPAAGSTELEDDNVIENDSNNEDENESVNDVITEITMNDVMNHPESPTSDFFCSDDGEGGLIIIEYLGEDEIVVIPEEIDGKSITKINKFAFSHDSSVKGIRLSNTITEVGELAFSQNDNLQYVVLGDGVEIIGEGAFQACTSLKQIVMNYGIKEIKQLAFSQCTALESITLPETIEKIEVIAFYLMADDFKIIGKAGSVAEAYANSESITFEAE